MLGKDPRHFHIMHGVALSHVAHPDLLRDAPPTFEIHGFELEVFLVGLFSHRTDQYFHALPRFIFLQCEDIFHRFSGNIRELRRAFQIAEARPAIDQALRLFRSDEIFLGEDSLHLFHGQLGAARRPFLLLLLLCPIRRIGGLDNGKRHGQKESRERENLEFFHLVVSCRYGESAPAKAGALFAHTE